MKSVSATLPCAVLKTVRRMLVRPVGPSPDTQPVDRVASPAALEAEPSVVVRGGLLIRRIVAVLREDFDDAVVGETESQRHVDAANS